MTNAGAAWLRRRLGVVLARCPSGAVMASTYGADESLEAENVLALKNPLMPKATFSLDSPCR